MIRQEISNSVIFAENDPQMRDLIHALLVNARQLAFPAADGLEALDLARRFKPRAVLLDIAMPGLNGLEVCRAIHGMPGYADVPIIMLTGHTETQAVQLARRFGASDFITKPFRPNTLLQCLAPWLDIPGHLLAAASGATPIEEADLRANAAVWKSARNRFSGAANGARPADAREKARLPREAQRGG